MFNIAEHAVTGLDASLDTLIKQLPEHLFGAPDDPFLEPEFSKDPFKTLALIRDTQGGIVPRDLNGLYGSADIFNVWGHDLSFPHFVALSYRAVREIGSAMDRFGNRFAYGAQEEANGLTVNCLDGPEHRQVRGLLDTAAFGRKQIEKRIDTLIIPLVSFLVERLCAKIAAGEPVDARRDIALPAAYKSIATVIGVPQHKFAYFVELGEIAQGGPRDMNAALNAIAEMNEFFSREFDRRTQEPQLDLLTALQIHERNGFKLTKEQIINHCRFLLPGGIETTWRMTANLIMAMMQHPAQYACVVEDLSLVDQAVEEALRWAPSGFVVPRRALIDSEVEGVEIPEGSYICSIQGIANRDPEVWDRPNEFDITRDPHPHLTFHIGIHGCMGQMLARGLFREVLKQLAEKAPTLRLTCKPSDIETRGFGVRCPTAVPLTA